jgi:hypothetical protein
MAIGFPPPNPRFSLSYVVINENARFSKGLQFPR